MLQQTPLSETDIRITSYTIPLISTEVIPLMQGMTLVYWRTILLCLDRQTLRPQMKGDTTSSITNIENLILLCANEGEQTFKRVRIWLDRYNVL